jgi:membrane-bound metal-dependent hydrolase YbcI (DUF457 family)
MPNYKTHLVAGIISFFSFLVLLKLLNFHISLEVLYFSLFVTLFASIFPDIDTKKSKIHRITFSILFILLYAFIIAYIENVFVMIFFLACLLFLHSSRFPFRHRKITHTLKFAFLFSLFIGIVSLFVVKNFLPAFFSFLGFFSHLVLDKKI